MSAASVFCTTCGATNPPDALVCFACGNPPLSADPQTLSSSSPTGLLGEQPLLKQRYRLLAQIGSGGFGAVYQAEDTVLGDRKVAVKEMNQRGLTPEEAQEATNAFRNEALLLAGLAHPNLPHIYDQFEEGGRWYLVMDFIEGETLEARLARMPGGRLPVQEVLKLGVQLCTVLDYLHTQQPPIIFRDLKPANIMITQSGDLFLIDFGIARHFKPGQTKDTVAFGSAGYAAPEQYGKAQTTTQSDIYSLGATLHHLMSGHDPSDSPFVFEPLDLAEPHGLEALILQMLDSRASKRPASMAVIKHDLERLADDLATRQKQRPAAVVPPPAPSSAAPATRPVVQSAPAPVRHPPAPRLLHRQERHPPTPRLLYRRHTERVNTVAWSPDGTMIASGGNDQTVQIWESASGTHLQTLPETDRVHALAWSPDGAQLAWVSQGKEVHLWRADTGEFSRLALPGLNLFNVFLAVTWAPDGSRLAAGGLGKTVEIWEVKTGKHELTYSGHRRFLQESSIYALAWSPDGESMASVSTDGMIQVWEVATAHLRCSYSGHQWGYLGHKGGVSWSPDSASLVSAGERATIHIWDAATAAQRLILNGHQSAVNRVSWSPDGQYIASASADRTVRVWDGATAKEVMAYVGHDGEVNAVAWSPDSKLLASGSDDHTVRIWQAR